MVMLYMYLNVDSPFQPSGHPERLPCVRILNVAKDEEIEEEPTNDFHQLTISLPLLLIHHILTIGIHVNM